MPWTVPPTEEKSQMGDAKRIADAEEQRRSKKIAFIREHAPQFHFAQLMSGKIIASAKEVTLAADILFEEIEERIKLIAMGEDK
jgi:hypothetical protein